MIATSFDPVVDEHRNQEYIVRDRASSTKTSFATSRHQILLYSLLNIPKW